MVKKYEKPPVVEAVCQLSFPNDVKWNPTISGLFYEKIKHKFPIIETKTKMLCSGIEEGKEEAKVFPQSYTFFSDDEKVFDIGISDQILIIRAKGSYPSWETFKRTILDCHSALLSILEDKLCKVDIYYNNMIMPDEQMDYENIQAFFKFRPLLDDIVSDSINDFIIGCEFEPQSQNTVCRITLTTTTKSPAKKKSYLLTLRGFSRENLQSTGISDWLENAHLLIKKMFENSLSKDLRERFGPVE